MRASGPSEVTRKPRGSESVMNTLSPPEVARARQPTKLLLPRRQWSLTEQDRKAAPHNRRRMQRLRGKPMVAGRHGSSDSERPQRSPAANRVVTSPWTCVAGYMNGTAAAAPS